MKNKSVLISSRYVFLLAISVFLISCSSENQKFRDGYAAYKKNDYVAAFKIWKPLAEKGHAKSQGGVAAMYISGRGVKQDIEEGEKWAEKSCNNGNHHASFFLGSMYLGGKYSRKDLKKSFYWFEKSANGGLAKSQHILGIMYRAGMGVKKNDKQAVYWMNKALKQGYIKAANSISWILSTSKDNSIRDGKRAVYIMEKLPKSELTYKKVDTLAAAYAESGMYKKATETQEKAIMLLRKNKEASKKYMDGAKQRLELYKQGKPWRETEKTGSESNKH